MRKVLIILILSSVSYPLLPNEVCALQWPWQKQSSQTAVKTAENRKPKTLNYEQLVQRNLELRKKLEIIEENYKSLENERNTLVLHIKELQKEKDNLVKAVKDLQQAPTAFPELKAKIGRISAELDAVTKERDRLQNELDKSKKRLADLDKTILDEVQKKFNQVRIERTALFRAMQDEKAKLQDEIDRIKAAFKKEKKRLERRIGDADAKKQKAEYKIQKLDKELQSVRAELQAKEKELKIERQKLIGEKKELERNFKTALIEKQQLEKSARRTADSIQNLKDRVKTLEAKIDELTAERSALSAEIKTLEADKRRLQADVKLAKHAQKAAEREKELAEKKVDEIKRKIDKERLDMHYNLAVVFDRNRMYEDAEREYLKCLKIDPDDAGVHYNLGILYDDKLNENELAIRHYKKFLELRPKGESSERVRQWMFNAEQEKRIGAEMR